MKTINGWVIVKALNKYDDIGIKILNDKIHMCMIHYKNKAYKNIDFVYNEISIEHQHIDNILIAMEKVMNRKANNIFCNNKNINQDLRLKLIDYNKAFKERDTLKILMYSHIGVNNSSYSEITISKESARNLYKILLFVKRQLSVA